MKLKKISIKNLRGLQSVEFDVQNLTTLIGKNNCGKSSILRGIELLCSGFKPDMEEFHLRGNEKIEIEGTFSELKDWERNNPSVSGLIHEDQLILKYVAEIIEERNKKKVDVTYYAYSVKEEIVGWSENWSGLSDEIKEIASQVDVTKAADFKTNAGKERVKSEIRNTRQDLITNIEPRWSNDSIAFNNSLQQAIPKVVLIPAVKDAEDESKFTKTGSTAFGELMKKIILPQIHAEESYKKILTAVEDLTNQIHSPEGIIGINDVNKKLSDRLSRMISATAKVRFENPDVDTIISSSVGLRIKDGVHDTPIGLQGHGVQRTLIFSLLELVAENDATVNDDDSRTTLILYEEPELYLHPQMLRKLKGILTTISNAEDWQVVCSTHSPVFINVAESPESLIILSKGSNGINRTKQLKENPFDSTEEGKIEREALRAALDFHPTVCEVFFADSVILVEGDTEMALFKHCDPLLSYCNVNLEKSSDCTIVSCGGKWTIPAIAKLLKKFRIEFKIVHDMDRNGKSDEQLAEAHAVHPFKANARIQLTTVSENIFICEDTLEDLWHGSKSDKPFSAIKKNEELVRNNMVPQRLVELVQFVYAGFLN